MKNLLCLAVAVAAVVGLTTSCSSKPAPVAMPPPKVTVSQPQVATVTNWDEFPGHVEAVESVELSARVSGYLDAIHFADGAEVKTGDLLFTIDPKPYQAELDRARAQRQQAETHLEWTRNDLKRAEELRGTKAISDEELDSRSKASSEAAAALAAAQAAEAAAKLNLDYTRVTAPISGRIGQRLVTVGNLVQGGSSPTVLATLVSLDPIYCTFDVEENAFLKYRSQMPSARGGDAKAVGPLCEVALANEEGFPHKGRLDFFDNQANPQTGTIRLRGVFPNADHALVPGMFAQVRLPAGPPEQTTLIPDVAVGSDQGYKFVYVVTQTNSIETRSIETGRQHGALREVRKGLSPEDRVVINGLMTVMMLPPGAKVEAQAAGADAPTAPSPKANPDAEAGAKK